ncbi:MAG: hypothetical protein ACQBVK_02500 [Candidatus Phytoplasma sp. TWB_XP]
MVFIIIPIIATSLIVAFTTYLYNIKKTQFSPQFRLQTKILFMISFFGTILLALFGLGINLQNPWTIFASLLWSFFNLIIGILMWAITLENLDLFVKEKIPKKYEWFIICLLFGSFFKFFFLFLKF